MRKIFFCSTVTSEGITLGTFGEFVAAMRQDVAEQLSDSKFGGGIDVKAYTTVAPTDDNLPVIHTFHIQWYVYVDEESLEGHYEKLIEEDKHDGFSRVPMNTGTNTGGSYDFERSRFRKKPF